MYMSLTALAVALFANAALCTPAPALEERAAGCPKGGTIDGRQCTTKCGVDHPGANIAAQPAANFKACIQACAANPECATAQFLTTNSYCYLKGPAIPAAQANPNVDSVICAGAVAPSPSPSPTTMTTPTASTVTVTDTTTVMATQTVSPSNTDSGCQNGVLVNTGSGVFAEVCNTNYENGDLSNPQGINSYQACIAACSGNGDCIGITWGNSQCYLKATLAGTDETGSYNNYEFSSDVFDSAVLTQPNRVASDDGNEYAPAQPANPDTGEEEAN